MAQSRSSKPLTEDIRAPHMVSAGLSNTPSTAGQIDNNFAQKAFSATAGNPDIEIYRVGSDDSIMIGGGQAVVPCLRPIFFRALANATVVTTKFHIFGVSGKIKKITEIHTTLGTDSAAVTGNITLDGDGTAPGAGTSVQSGTFNLKGTNSTLQTATLASTNGVSFSANQSLSFKLTGTATAVAGISICIWVQYDSAVQEVSLHSAAITSQDQNIFLFNRPYAILSMQYTHSAAETTDTTSQMQVTQDTSTNAPGAGTDLLTNNTNTGFSCNATANVVQAGAFTAGTTPVAGDRLSVDFDASNTELAGVCVTITLAAQANRIEVTYKLYTQAATDFTFFTADRDYELYDGRFLQAVAAGSTATAQIEKESGTTAPGAGSVTMLNTAWNLNATANTVVVADLVTVKDTILIPALYRLSFDYANTIQSTAGIAFTLSLMGR